VIPIYKKRADDVRGFRLILSIIEKNRKGKQKLTKKIRKNQPRSEGAGFADPAAGPWPEGGGSFSWA
jgi:hypothetical protein